MTDEALVGRRSLLRRTWRPIACTLAGVVLCLLGLTILGRQEAACVVEAMPSVLGADPPYHQEMTLFPLQWSCTWLSLEGSPVTTHFDPFAAVAFYTGLLLTIGSVLTLGVHLVRRTR